VRKENLTTQEMLQHANAPEGGLQSYEVTWRNALVTRRRSERKDWEQWPF